MYPGLDSDQNNEPIFTNGIDSTLRKYPVSMRMVSTPVILSTLSFAMYLPLSTGGSICTAPL